MNSMIGLTLSRLLVTLAPLLVTCWAIPALADKNPKGLADDIKRQEREIGEARKKLQAAKQEVDSAKQALRRAEQAVDRAVEKTGDVRRAVQTEHDASPELVAARKQAEQSRTEFEQATAPVLERLRQSTDYQAAVAARDRTKLALANLPAGASNEERERAGKAATDALAAMRKLENDALSSDPNVRPLRQKRDDAEERVRQLIDRRDRAIDSDSRLTSAKNDLDKLKSELAKAKDKHAREQQQVTSAQRRLNQEEQQKNQLEQKRKQQQNKNKKK